MHTHNHSHPDMHGAEKSRVALVSIFASGGLVITKFAVALLTGSLALMVEALHSLMDLAATIVTFFAVRWGGRPADGSHHYGHGKIESLAALFEVALLFVLAIYATFEGISRLIGEDHGDVSAPPVAIAILLLSIVVDFFRARALAAAANKTSSQALEADSLHFVSDMWASAAALCGLLGIAAGFPKADALAALVVAAIIVWISYGLFFRTIHTLLDAAPEGSTDLVERICADISGVVKVGRVRLREVGAQVFCEITLDVARTLPFERVDEIRADIIRSVQQALPRADVSVVTHPVALEDESIAENIMMIAARQHVFIHHLTVQQTSDKLAIGLDIELDEHMSLLKAHEVATRLELAIVKEFGSTTEVETHIEPLESYSDIKEANESERLKMEAEVQQLALQHPLLSNIHSLRLRQTKTGKIVVLHCHLAGQLSVRNVHDAVDALERSLRQTHPDIIRVVIHPEPDNVSDHHH